MGIFRRRNKLSETKELRLPGSSRPRTSSLIKPSLPFTLQTKVCKNVPWPLGETPVLLPHFSLCAESHCMTWTFAHKAGLIFICTLTNMMPLLEAPKTKLDDLDLCMSRHWGWIRGADSTTMILLAEGTHGLRCIPSCNLFSDLRFLGWRWPTTSHESSSRCCGERCRDIVLVRQLLLLPQLRLYAPGPRAAG